MKKEMLDSVYKTGKCVLVDRCQISGSTDLRQILFAGYIPPVNTMPLIGKRPDQSPAYPAELLYCPESKLVQIGLIVDPCIIFPPEYAYTSGTTRILRENFTDMYEEAVRLFDIDKGSLVIDIGSNDGTLLKNWANNGYEVLGVEPTDIAKLATEAGIRTHNDYFSAACAQELKEKYGKAKVVTATNVFAHIEDPNSTMEAVKTVLDEDGIFISESHYLMPLLETLQYDTIYHEHLRYYSLQSLQYLFDRHGLEIIHACDIPTHGGSIRVYAALKGALKVQPIVQEKLKKEDEYLTKQTFSEFKDRVIESKLKLMSLLERLKVQEKARICGIGAPSRASTIMNYVGLDEGIIDYVLEIKGSQKIGKYMPGTMIPVLEESILYEEQPEYALLFSWHIAEELIPKIRKKGFKGKFIVPLPKPRIVD